MAKKITDAWLRTTTPPAAKKDFEVPGHTGLIVRVYPTGAKVFLMRYTYGDKRPWFRIGHYGEGGLSLLQVHELHLQAQKDLELGLDPKMEHDKRREAAVRATLKGKTVSSAVAEWMWYHARHERKRPMEALRLLRVNLVEPWKGRPLASLRRRDAVLLLDKIKNRGAKVMANRIHALGNQVFTFAVARELTEINPFLGIPAPGGTETPRERWLDADEVRIFWHALDTSTKPISRRLVLALRLVLMTGQRSYEVGGAAFSEFDLIKRYWCIPASRIKTERQSSPHEHVVPLTDSMIKIVEELKELAEGRPHLFPSSRTKQQWGSPISDKTLTHVLSDQAVDDPNDPACGTTLGLKHFTVHDLRRTVASHLEGLKVQRLHIDKLLNHSEGKKTDEVYFRFKYFEEKRLAVEKWETELLSIVASKPAESLLPGQVPSTLG